MRKLGVVGAAGILALGLGPLNARADDAPSAPAPDKSQYTLFNPTPDDQMRSFCTDRPTKSNGPCTLDAGHFQYETDGINWTHSSIAGTTQNIFLYTNPTLKLGLTNRMDLDLNMAPFEEVKTRNNATGTKTDVTGVGDLFARVKYNLFGNDSGDIAMTLLPYVKIPTAKAGIGNKSVEGGMIVPLSFALPMDLTLVVDPEVDVFRNSSNSGYHTNFQGLVNLSHTIVENVTGAVEIWSDINRDSAGTSRQWSLDFAVSWVIRPNLQVDIGTNIGLNRVTPDANTYFGISQRF